MRARVDDRLAVLVDGAVMVGVRDEAAVLVSQAGQGPRGPQGAPGPPGPRRGDWAPDDHNLVAWAFDPAVATAGSVAPAGQLVTCRLHVHEPQPVHGIGLGVLTAGSGLVAGQCFAALYDEAGALVDVSTDQSTAWQTAGAKTCDFAGGPRTLPVGEYQATWWHNGTTGPSWLRMAGTPWVANAFLSAAQRRFGLSSLTFTDTAPPTMPSTADAMSYWASLYGPAAVASST